MREPKDCTAKPHIREAIDQIDKDLVDLLAKRDSYVRRMAELKVDPSEARSETRVREVLNNVLSHLEAADLAPDLYMQFWEDLIELNIAYEEAAIAARLKARNE